jgi:uncharacterized membrane protein YfcA
MLEIILIVLAGFVVGVINGMAGGGSLLSYPVLLAAGLSPVPAAITNAVGITPANFFGLITVRKEIGRYLREYKKMIYLSVAGSIVGSLLLLNLPPRVFEKLVPFLLFGATATMLVKVKAARGKRHLAMENIGMTASGLYCGYFGPGQGVMVIAVLARDAARSPKVINTAKNLITGIAAMVANTIYAFSGQVHWGFAAALFAGAALGGTLGGHLSGKVPPLLYRSLVMTVGFGASAWLFTKYF